MVNKFLSIILGISFLVQFINSQLEQAQNNQMKTVINLTKDEKTGLYGQNFESTYKAVFSLEVLGHGEEVRDVPRICKELGYETQKSPSRYVVLLDELLKCRNEIGKSTDNPSNITSLSIFYESLFLTLRREKSLSNSEYLFLKLQTFQNKDKLFNQNNIDNPLSDQASLLYTAYGLKSMALLHKELSQKFKDKITEDILEIVTFMNKHYFQNLNEVHFHKLKFIGNWLLCRLLCKFYNTKF